MNIRRLEILKDLSIEKRSFSSLSNMTGLCGGNLLFHIGKLTDNRIKYY